MKENQTLKQQLEAMRERLDQSEKDKEVSTKKRCFQYIDFFVQAIDDEFRALQLACTQVERVNQELVAANDALREKLTEKLERVYRALDAEVKNHEEFVSFIFLY